MTIRSVGILGCGTMGVGIARTCAAAGYKTTLVKVTPGSPDAPRAKLERGSFAAGAEGTIRPRLSYIPRGPHNHVRFIEGTGKRRRAALVARLRVD